MTPLHFPTQRQMCLAKPESPSQQCSINSDIPLFVIKSAGELFSLYQIVLVLFSLIFSCKKSDSLELSIPGLQSDEIFILYIPRARLLRKSLYVKGNNPIPIKVTFGTNGMLPQTVLTKTSGKNIVKAHLA